MRAVGNKSGAQILRQIRDETSALSIAEKIAGMGANQVSELEASSLTSDADLSKSMYNKVKNTSATTKNIFLAYKKV